MNDLHESLRAMNAKSLDFYSKLRAARKRASPKESQVHVACVPSDQDTEPGYRCDENFEFLEDHARRNQGQSFCSETGKWTFQPDFEVNKPRLWSEVLQEQRALARRS